MVHICLFNADNGSKKFRGLERPRGRGRGVAYSLVSLLTCQLLSIITHSLVYKPLVRLFILNILCAVTVADRSVPRASMSIEENLTAKKITTNCFAWNVVCVSVLLAVETGGWRLWVNLGMPPALNVRWDVIYTQIFSVIIVCLLAFHCRLASSYADFRDLKIRVWRRQWKRYLKSEFAFFQSWSRLFQLIYCVIYRRILLEFNSQDSYPSSERKKEVSLWLVFVLHKMWN